MWAVRATAAAVKAAAPAVRAEATLAAAPVARAAAEAAEAQEFVNRIGIPMGHGVDAIKPKRDPFESAESFAASLGTTVTNARSSVGRG